MFDLNDAYTTITVEEILNKIPQDVLWKYYCPQWEVGKLFLSPLYKDTKPSCSIFNTDNNNLMLKDFGTGEVYNIFNFIKAKYNITFNEVLNVISNDFNLRKVHYDVKPKEYEGLSVEEKLLLKPSRTNIIIEKQPYNYTDFSYWTGLFKIPLTILEKYNVYSCKTVWLYKNDRIIRFDYRKSNPIYAYEFKNNGIISYKIYFPLADKKHKWLNNCNDSIIQGYDQLSINANPKILTKSLKDVMCYRVLGYDAIALQSETNRLPEKLNVIVNYDNDDEGRKGTDRLVNEYGFKYFYIDEAKDLSDYIKDFGLKKAKTMLKHKINNV